MAIDIMLRSTQLNSVIANFVNKMGTCLPNCDQFQTPSRWSQIVSLNLTYAHFYGKVKIKRVQLYVIKQAVITPYWVGTISILPSLPSTSEFGKDSKEKV